ncbi:MAG: zinc ribbon domain-containing protein [Candidatus Thorarchaeota archaeon]|nr:MAG: zinc ribbon domain-containing protein [Candidatus Thorarchaeota archaeon]
MDENLVVCPSCGSEVVDTRFCGECGERLFPSEEVSTDIPTAEIEDEVTFQSYPGQVDDIFGLRVESIDERSSLILFARAEIVVLNRELERLIEQIQATRQALRLERSDKKQLAARAEKLSLLFEDIKARKKVLGSFKGELWIEELLRLLSQQEAEMERLDNIRESKDPKDTQEEKKETKKSLKKLKGDLKRSTNLVKKWLKGVQDARKRFLRDKDRLDAKHRIGDLAMSAYDQSRANLMRSIGILSESELQLVQILENVQS